MAKVTVSRKRKPIAEGEMTCGIDQRHTVTLNISVPPENDDDERQRYATATLDSAEVTHIVDLVAGTMTHDHFTGGFYNVDRRSLPEKLRALADKLEAEAKALATERHRIVDDPADDLVKLSSEQIDDLRTAERRAEAEKMLCDLEGEAKASASGRADVELWKGRETPVRIRCIITRIATAWLLNGETAIRQECLRAILNH